MGGTCVAARALALSMWWLIGLVLAGPVRKMDKLLEQGEYAEVVEIGERYLEKSPDARDVLEVEARLTEASFELARAEDSLETWAAFNERFSDCDYCEQARTREAELAWELVRESSNIEELAAYQENYPEGPHAFEARTREANLAWESTEQQDTEEAWKAWAESYADDPRAGDARLRQQAAAVAAARELKEAGALREVLLRYPDMPERSALEGEILMNFAVLESPCTGAPIPSCDRLEAGSVIAVSWEEAPDRPVTVEFMRWSAVGTKDLGEAFTAWAGPWEAEAQELAEALKGKQEDGHWSLTLPVTLRAPSPGGGYAVVLDDGEHKAVLSMAVTESWGPATTRTTGLFVGADGVWVGPPGAQPVQVATLSDGESLVHGRFLYRWGASGLQRVDLDLRRVEILDSSVITGLWVSDGGLVWERQDGTLLSGGGQELPFTREGAWMALHPDGGRVALLRTGESLGVRVLDLQGEELASFKAPAAEPQQMYWSREGLFVLAGEELALKVDVANGAVQPTDFRKAKEQVTGIEVPWKVTGSGSLSTELEEDGSLSLVVYNAGVRGVVLTVDPAEGWALSQDCAAVLDIQATWLPDGRIGARVVREHCGDSMRGPLFVLGPAGGTPLLIESRGEGLPDWLLTSWHGGVLLLPDGRSVDTAGLNPAPPTVDEARWYTPGLFSLL